MKLLPVIIITPFLIMITQISNIVSTEVKTLKGPMEADKDYSPYTFVYQLTGFFGAIFVIGPLIVPQGPNREVIRVGIMLTAFYMWISWVTIYCSQIHPMTSLMFTNNTLAFLAYSWGSVGNIPVVKLPQRSTTTLPPRTRPTTTKGVAKEKKVPKKKRTTTKKPPIILTRRTRYKPSKRNIARGKMRDANLTTAEKSLRTGSPMEDIIINRKPMDTSTGTPTTTSSRTATSTSTHTQSSTSTHTQSSTSTRTQSDLVVVDKYYKYYQVEVEPISLKVLVEEQPYRQFFVMLSAKNSWSEPRILIFIGSDNGSKCTISKNGRIMIRTICHLNWRNDTYLPFWIWFKDGEIVVKSGYGHPDYLKPTISWIDPKPFDVKYYALRTKTAEEISVILNDRYFESNGPYDEYERDEELMEFD